MALGRSPWDGLVGSAAGWLVVPLVAEEEVVLEELELVQSEQVWVQWVLR